MLLVHLFVCFVRISFCHFSFPFDVVGWLRFMIVALPGLFYYLFFNESMSRCNNMSTITLIALCISPLNMRKES